jgi:hypothetical protein
MKRYKIQYLNEFDQVCEYTVNARRYVEAYECFMLEVGNLKVIGHEVCPMVKHDLSAILDIMLGA